MFDTMRRIDRREFEFYDRLTPDEKKGFSIPVFLRTASAVQGDPDIRDWYILAINERANLYHPALKDHPDLQYKLMASCGLGMPQNHYWINMPKRLPKADALFDFIKEEWPGANELECKIIVRQIDEEKLISLCREAGVNQDRLQEIIEAYGRYTNKEPTKPKKKGKKRA